MLETLLTAFMVLVLVIFLLIEHGTLRDRLLTFGVRPRHAHHESARRSGARISRYLRMQALVNGSFGLLFGLGLFFLGLPYAVLWGLLAAVLRFIPMSGRSWRRCSPSGSASPSSRLDAAARGQWPVCAAGTGHQLGARTRALGHSAGISQVAILVAVLFWSWLWGPVGLLLSTPLTVCLSVLGKYVSPLAFLGWCSPMSRWKG